MNTRHILTSAGLLAVFALIGTALVAGVYAGTQARIMANEQAALLSSLQELIPPEGYDNNPLLDTLTLAAPSLDGSRPITVYRARKQGEPVAVVLTAVAPNGYGGPIDLLVGIRADGRIAGVRVTRHRETPGLGDGIEAKRSDWIRGFDGKSLQDPGEKQWKVRRDGGIFDQFTGATISPRAVVQAVHEALVYFEAHRDTLFTQSATSSPAEEAHHG